jgi:hypothetical protein
MREGKETPEAAWFDYARNIEGRLFSTGKKPGETAGNSGKITRAIRWDDGDKRYSYIAEHKYNEGKDIHNRSKLTTFEPIPEGDIPPEKQSAFMREILVSGPLDARKPPRVENFNYVFDADEQTDEIKDRLRLPKDVTEQTRREQRKSGSSGAKYETYGIFVDSITDGLRKTSEPDESDAA